MAEDGGCPSVGDPLVCNRGDPIHAHPLYKPLAYATLHLTERRVPPQFSGFGHAGGYLRLTAELLVLG
jgi:hypothetical protein